MRQINLRSFSSVKRRREHVEKTLGIKLPHMGNYSLDEHSATSKNCENMIGVTQVPLGVAGPLRLTSARSGQAIKNQDFYIPLATTEGALVASINRGCKAINDSGGALVDSYQVGATRGCVFKVGSLLENDKLNVFLEGNFNELRKVAEMTSKHIQLKKLFSRGLGKYRYVRFVYDTQDAMGMNMVTIATDAIVRFVEKKTGFNCLSLAGNYDVDKKPSWLNFIEGRGTKVWAETVLSENVLKAILKTNAQNFYEVWLAKCMLGSAMAGSLGFNAQYANIVAALFIATGQDPAHVVEGSLGVTTTEIVKGKDLYISIYLPDLMVGTVGGGTGLATQQEALSMLGVAGGNAGKNSRRFAEIIAAAVLAGEISLLASLAQGSLALAHERLGRGKIGK